MTLPTKPEVTIIGDRLAVFMGSSYQLMPLNVADSFVRRLQGELARLKRQVKREERAQRKAQA
ncbi:MAG TPA: hypothetical protein VN617_00010 [Rhodoferax sp.]|nr:hypothetical protein [Rhodoferax sp.]